MLKGILRGWAWLENALVIVLLAAMLILATVQVVLRNFFDAGIDWAEPFQQYALLWLGFLGAAIASREGKHIAIDAFVMFLPKQVRSRVSFLPAIFTAIVCAFAAWCSWLLLAYEMESGDVAFGAVPLWAVVAIMPFSFGVMSLRALTSLFFRKEAQAC